jgi:deoxyribonuclease-4
MALPEHDPRDLEAFRERRRELDIGAVLVHALYLVNLASPNDEFYEKSVATMNSTMDAACAIEADGVVLHVGSHLGAGFESGLERAVPALRQILEHSSDTTWLLMENSAGAGGTIGRSLDELAVLFDACDRHERLGVCLDSCHLWVSGYDVTDRSDLDALVGQVRRADRHRPPARAPRERRRGAAWLQPRPPREHALERARASARSSRTPRFRSFRR